MGWTRTTAATTATMALVAAGLLAGGVSANASTVHETSAAAPPAAAVPAAAPSAAAPPAGQLVPGQLQSAVVGGPIDYTAYLPAGYDPDASTRYPSVYLLHGRGDSQSAWQQVAGDLDEMIADGSIPPMVVIMPDAPWSDRGNYYVDSQYTGTAPGTSPGVAVESAFTTDLIDWVDSHYATIADRAARVVGGYSMGGAGALRFATAHPELFSAGLVLSPAVYYPSTPVDSSTREFGAYGVGDALYDESRYQALNYPATFAAFDPARPVHLFIAVGDDEYVNPAPEDAIHDLDYEAATLYNQAKRVPGITAEFRAYDGGHDWGVWEQGFREGMRDISGYLATEPVEPLTGVQTGSAGDDFAGGVLGSPDGGVVQAVNVAGDALGQTAAGGTDVLVQKFSADGTSEWVTPLATALNERMYGVVSGGGDGSVITAGYQRTDHAGAQNDDAFAAKIGPRGSVLWSTAFGDPAAADRAYGVTADGQGGAFLAGYSSGVVGDGAPAGDKDAVVAHVDAAGAVTWSAQFGSPGEDKAFAAAPAPDGGVYVGGTAGGAMPGATSAGGYDAWVAEYSAEGEQLWLQQFGTSETDQVSALAATATGVVAAGFTGGTLGASSSGGNDAVVAAFGVDGSSEWLTQAGTPADDRAAGVLVGADDRMLVAGHTSGAFGSPAGGVDVFTLAVDSSGAPGDVRQLGTPQRDGADVYDEANLFIAPGASGQAWLQAVTYGSIADASNAGGADVFLTSVPFAADGSGEPGHPGGPGAPGEGAGGGAPGAGADGSAVGGASGALGETGLELARALAIALLVLGAGVSVLVLRRRLHARA
ncbi:alpha/beta hydrolase-fold protein [Herbiconiux sp. CPCC 205763]|uniref:Alpha/beta hydrolase-fold protein n=1 Tax=Herbiconiux aconitum TaxID=2970913 RepID=A0ABT2GQB9_9MICO|nr:alpha/beta hydrolase-fold protein [Herbiconiux aconitum]MCS5718417.1 alpha/beta hydrolase-fold protein [Herbiconiux aconitum]